MDTQVLVVGGGIMGASVAHHLSAAGAGRVMLLDAGTPGRATSDAGAGFVGAFAAGYMPDATASELAIEQAGMTFYLELAESDPSIGVHQVGSLFSFVGEAGWAAWSESLLTHPLRPERTRTLTPRETADITAGVLDADSVVGSVLHPGGLQLSAGRATRAVVRRAAERGVEVVGNTRVDGLLVDERGVRGVRTDAGEITAQTVVLACGAWTNAVLAGSGVQVALERIIATRVISPPSGVAAGIPTVMVPDLNGLWVREHRGGLTWGNVDGYAPVRDFSDVATSGQPHEEVLVQRLQELLLPSLRRLIPDHDLSLQWWVQGMPCMTPDGFFLAGPIPDLPGLWVLGGDNEAGVTHGPGLGAMLADVITTGGCDWADAARYRPDRFPLDGSVHEERVAELVPKWD